MMMSNLLPYICVLIITVVLVGCSKDTPETSQSAEAQVASKPTPEPDPISPAEEKVIAIADPIVERAVRKSLKKPEGELTEADLAKVTDLDLHNTFITDAGLKEVVKLQQLKLLDLFRTQVTDEGLKDLAKLQHLTILILSLTNTTDAGLEDVAKLQKLTRLALEDTNISDASLKNLVKLKRLESLWLYDTNVTKAGAAELQKALPNGEIVGP